MKMKHSINNNWVILFIVISMLSCESERDSFKDLTSEGEQVVIGKVRGAKVSYGIHKLKFDLAINADPKIKKFTFSEGEEEIRTFDLVRNNIGADTITLILDNLKEKVYDFNIVASDNEGNKSLTYRLTSTVFGDRYIANLPSRAVTNMTFDPVTGMVEAMFSKNKENMKETNLIYTTRDNIEKTITIPNDSGSLIISDFKTSDTLKLVSTYSPVLNERISFEDFVSPEVNKVTFPSCEREAVASTSVTNMDFGQNDNGSSGQQTFTVKSDDCITSTEIYAKAVDSEQFLVSLSSSGPFEPSVLLGDISSEKTVYVKFNADTGKNKVFTGSVKVEGANITSPIVIAVTGEEIGNIKSGLLVLNKDREGPFRTVGLPGDAGPHLGWGGLFHETLFDGNWRTLAHSQQNAIPGVFTIDLAAEYDIVKAGWVVRGDKCCGGTRALKKYQIWGLPDVADIMDAVPTVELTSETEKEWATSMLDKGWKNMVNASLTENPNSRSDGRVTHPVPVQPPVRYIRVAVFETFGNVGNFDFGELELTADFGQ